MTEQRNRCDDIRCGQTTTDVIREPTVNPGTINRGSMGSVNDELPGTLTLDEQTNERVRGLNLHGQVNQLAVALTALERARTVLGHAQETVDERVTYLVDEKRLTKNDVARLCDVSPQAIAKTINRHEVRMAPPSEAPDPRPR